jgi:hypothetical protein
MRESLMYGSVRGTKRPPQSVTAGLPCVAQRQGAIMKLPRRQFLHLTAGAAALPAVSAISPPKRSRMLLRTVTRCF